ncbi:MAG TPA: sigma-70 family RNA polymerase sigma factor [Polyangiaceae bacterium]|nr:sigma-70 family RNA polymerase sigma factor [Polyangiaceae bacterium]
MSTPAARFHDGASARTTDQAVPWTFAAVYDANFAFVWRSVRRLGVVDSAVDDVVQEVFIVVHRQLSRFRGESSIRAWLFAIASRIVRDARRSLRRKPGNLGGRGRVADDVDLVADIAPSPHDTAANGEAVRTLHAVLDAMRKDRREVFILAELEQMTVADIAAAVRANANTVYSRLRAARADFERAVTRARANDRWRIR